MEHEVQIYHLILIGCLRFHCLSPHVPYQNPVTPSRLGRMGEETFGMSDSTSRELGDSAFHLSSDRVATSNLSLHLQIWTLETAVLISVHLSGLITKEIEMS